MKLTYYGHATFELVIGNLTIVTDPCDIGYPRKPTRADVITESHQHHDHNDTAGIDCARILSAEGQHEVDGVTISAIPCYHDTEHGAKRGSNLIFTFEAEGLKIAHLGDLGHVLSADTLKDVDVLLIPVGGYYTIDTDEAIEVIRNVAPRIAIPMHYKTDRIDFPIESAARFASLTGAVLHSSPGMEITAVTMPGLPSAIVLPYLT